MVQFLLSLRSSPIPRRPKPNDGPNGYPAGIVSCSANRTACSSEIWDASTFSKNREHRFDESGVLESLFDDRVKKAMTQGLVSTHWSVDGTLVRADASYKSFVPIEVYQSPKEYKKAIRGNPKPKDKSLDKDPGNPTMDWKGQKRS